MSATKLIFINRFYHPNDSATAQMLTDLAVEMARENKPVHVISSALSHNGHALLPSELLTHGDVHTHWVKTTGFGHGSDLARMFDHLSFYPGAFLKLLMLCKPGDVVVVKTDPPLLSVPLLLAVRLKRGKLVNWLQDLYPEVAAELGVPFLKGKLGKFLTRLRNGALRRSTLNVVIGEKMRDRLLAAGIEGRNIEVIHNWADDKNIQPKASKCMEMRRVWGISESAFVVGYSGNLGRAHEADTILGAARKLRDRKDILFLFVGVGSERQRLVESMEQEGLPNIIFKDYEPREKLSSSLAAADVHWISLRTCLEGLIVPSKFYGIAAAGRPILAVTDLDGEIANIVRKGDCGEVVTPGDVDGLVAAILRLASDEMQTQAKGRRAREMLDTNFSRAAAIRRWRGALDRVASSARAIQVP